LVAKGSARISIRVVMSHPIVYLIVPRRTYLDPEESRVKRFLSCPGAGPS
jgi:hypothetical protein